MAQCLSLVAVPAAAGPLQTLRGHDLSFGTSIYPFRLPAGEDASWILAQARLLGLTELRVEYSRERVDRSGANDVAYNAANYVERRPELLRELSRSGFDIVLVLDGHRQDRSGRPVDWPRRPDGTIDGAAAAPGMANFAAWTFQKTHTFVMAYELWNEAFAAYWDPFAKVGFGPGGSQENANGYAAMFLPVVRRLRALDPKVVVAVEGNYWNLSRSVDASDLFQRLLSLADYAVIHPYDYGPSHYEPGERSNLYRILKDYPRYNPGIRLWFTEFNVGPRSIGVSAPRLSDKGQATALLRATLLHLSHGVRHLDVFAMYYPSTPAFTLIDLDRKSGARRPRPAFFALQRFLSVLAPRRPSREGSLSRTELPAGLSDLAVARPDGFAYLIWQETAPATFEDNVPRVPATVRLSVPGSKLRLARVLDPLTNREVPFTARRVGSDLELSVAVPDYPLLCTLADDPSSGSAAGR